MYFLRINIVVASVLFSFVATSQSHDSIPLSRKIIHADIDKIQQAIAQNLKISDSVYSTVSNQKIEDLQNRIEKNSSIDPIKKIKFLKGLHEVLKDFQYYYRNKEFKKDQLAGLMDAFQRATDLI